MKAKTKITINTLLAILVIILAVAYSFVAYFNNQNEQLLHFTQLLLSEDTTSTSQQICKLLDDSTADLQSFSDFLSNNTFADDKTISSHIKNFKKYTYFNEIFYANSKGSAIDSSGINFYCSDYDYFKKSMDGKINISAVDSEDGTTKNLICISVPVMSDSSAVGVLGGFINFDEIIPVSFNGKGTHSVIDKSGTFISQPNDSIFSSLGDNLFDVFTDNSYNIKSDILKNKNGILDYANSYFVYEPIGINNWYLVTGISKDYVTSIVNPQNIITFRLAVRLSIIFIIILACILYAHKRYKKQQNKITKAFALNEERYKIVSSLSNNIVFEYNPYNDTINYFGKDTNNYLNLLNNSSKTGLDKFIDIVNCEYKQKIIDTFDKAKQGIGEISLEYKVQLSDNDYSWYELTLDEIVDSDGVAKRILGNIKNIDYFKKAYEKLTVKAHLDPLTKLYNRETAVELIEKYLLDKPTEELSAMLSIDIDNFKSINDNKGHLFGDAVLIEIANTLKREFRSTDIVARMGGDEFLIFIKGIGSAENVYRKAEDIGKLFARCMLEAGEDITISGSIGIVICPKDGTTYQELYRKADMALYSAKNKGKNCYIAYGYDVDKWGGVRTPNNDREISAKLINTLNPPLADIIFNMLYSSDDVKQTLPKILELIAKTMNANRTFIAVGHLSQPEYIYIYAYSTKNIPSCSQFLEECIERNYSMMAKDGEEFFHCNKDNFPADFSEMFDELEVKSMLAAYIYKNTDFMGILGIDDCTKKRIWDKDEIENLTLISKIISTFLYR